MLRRADVPVLPRGRRPLTALQTSRPGRLGGMWQQLVVWVYTRTPERARRAVVRALSPTYTVGVVVVLRRPDGRVLLTDAPYRAGWSLPGGDLQRRESARDGAARELREELGITVDVPQPVLAHHRLHDRWVTFVVAVDVDEATAEAARTTSPELSGIAWFATDELPELDEDAAVPLRLAGL
ncbi:MAG: putative MutT/NUDIX-family protein [Frankiales bacterium]|nr:putative MutT/NUDIX-family protein [Frankiales bacterium]